MAQRLTLCPKCQCRFVNTVKIHNPETTSLNAQATLKCSQCAYQWEGRVSSPYVVEQRRLGRMI